MEKMRFNRISEEREKEAMEKHGKERNDETTKNEERGSEKLDESLSKIMRSVNIGNMRRRLEADASQGEVPEMIAPYNLLSGLKANVIDPLAEELKIDPETRKSTKDILLDHYRTFYFPGNVRYDPKSENKSPEIKEPTGLSYVIQKILIKKAGFRIDNGEAKFFEPQKDSEIPSKDLKNALKVYVSDWERGVEKTKNETTKVLYETFKEAGLYDDLDQKEKLKMDGLTFLDNDVIKSGKWLNFVSSDFFDVKKINLFKINTWLSEKQISAIMDDILSGEKVTAGNLKDVMTKRFSEPISPETAKKHHLEYLINRQSKESIDAKRYLSAGSNSYTSKIFGKVILAPSEEKLSGPLPAINAKPPLDGNTGKQEWEQPNAYFESSDLHLLGYMKSGLSKDVIPQIIDEAENEGLSVQVNEIAGWTKLYIPFNGKKDVKFLARLKKDWLKISSESAQNKISRFKEGKKRRISA